MSAHVSRPAVSDSVKLPIEQWSRLERVLIEMYEAETLVSHKTDPDGFPISRTDDDWIEDYASWRRRKWGAT